MDKPRFIFSIFCAALTSACIPMKAPEPGIPAKPACSRCAANLITVDPANPSDPGSKDMDLEMPGMMDGCSTRTFTCAGSNPVIEINSGASMVTDAASAKIVATCNAAGTAWERNGEPVTKVACTIPCKRCAASSLQISQSFSGMTPTTGASIDRTGACATWNLVCAGPSQQSWEINGGEGNFPDSEDGALDGIVNLATTCDKSGMFFMYKGLNIMTADCAAAN